MVILLLLALLQIVRTPFTADLSAFLPASPDARQFPTQQPQPAGGGRRLAGRSRPSGARAGQCPAKRPMEQPDPTG